MIDTGKENAVRTLKEYAVSFLIVSMRFGNPNLKRQPFLCGSEKILRHKSMKMEIFFTFVAQMEIYNKLI